MRTVANRVNLNLADHEATVQSLRSVSEIMKDGKGKPPLVFKNVLQL